METVRCYMQRTIERGRSDTTLDHGSRQKRYDACDGRVGAGCIAHGRIDAGAKGTGPSALIAAGVQQKRAVLAFSRCPSLGSSVVVRRLGCDIEFATND